MKAKKMKSKSIANLNDGHYYDNAHFLSADNLMSRTCSPSSSNDNLLGINSQKKAIRRIRFSPQEDKLLLQIISNNGTSDWNKISDEFSKQSQSNYRRTPRQCKDRYINYLSPEVQYKKWTYEEDQCLILNFFLFPFHWRSIQKSLPGRSEIAIKNRFNRIQKEGMGFLRPIINSIKQNPKYNSILSDHSNISKLQINLSQFKSSKENCIKSIISDAGKMYCKFKKNDNTGKSIIDSDNISEKPDDIFTPQNDEYDLIQLNSEYDSFDFQDTFDMFDE